MLKRTFECAALAATIALGLGLSGAAVADDAGDMTRQTYLELTGTPVEEAAPSAPTMAVTEVLYEAHELAECGEFIVFDPLSAKQLAALAESKAQHVKLLAKVEATKALEPKVWSYEQNVPSAVWH